jgi:hypothetical protein
MVALLVASAIRLGRTTGRDLRSQGDNRIMKSVIVVATLMLLAGCSGSAHPGAAPVRSADPTSAATSSGGPARGLTTRVPPPSPTVAIGQSDYHHSETFCAASPANGRIRYDGGRSDATLQVTVSGLTPGTDLGVGWHNAHSPRGYTIASFRTSPTGRGQAATLRMFRGPETRGDLLVLANRAGRAVARLRPCS